MIEAIREIGKYALKKANKNTDEPLEILIDDPSNRDTKNILFISIKNNNGIYDYKGVELEEFSKDKLKMYLYRKGSSNGSDLSPTSMITEIEKTFIKQKTLRWFKPYLNIKEKNENAVFLSEVEKCLTENKDKILTDLKLKYKKENNIISLKIDDKYIGEYEVFQNLLIEQAKKNFYHINNFSKENQNSKSKDKICAVCKIKKDEVYGFVRTFKFYTVDKPGFVSSGFQQKDAWKNYPVCLECALILEEGKKYLGSTFDFNFYGIKYLLIPKFISKVNENEKKTVMKIFEKQRDPTFRKTNVKRLTSDEKEIFENVSELKNYLNLNFLFYNAPKGFDGAVFNILSYIEDILPSRIKKLFDAKKQVDSVELFKNHLVPVYENNEKVGEELLEFNFGILFNFFPFKIDPKTRKLVGFDKYFLNVVNKVFTNKQVDYYFLLKFITNKIRLNFVNGYSTATYTLKGFMLLMFLRSLGLIEIPKGENNMNEQLIKTKGEISEKVEDFFNNFANFFNNGEKKAVFLVGVLAQFLLNIQRLPDVSNASPGKEPFRPRLKGLKLDKKQIEKLLPEIQNKLEEYGKNYYLKLEEMISKYFVLSNNNWSISNDEISFYFVLGMNLSNNFKTEKENKKEGEENE